MRCVTREIRKQRGATYRSEKREYGAGKRQRESGAGSIVKREGDNDVW